jgi:hypothetical protein
MRKNFKTLNEQMDRMKQLMDESRLYGNLINEGLLNEGGPGKFLVKSWDEISSVLGKKGITITDDIIEKFKVAPNNNFDDLLKHLEGYKYIWDEIIQPPNNVDNVLVTLRIAKKQGNDFDFFSKIPGTDEFWYEALPVDGNFRVNALESYRNKIGNKKFNEYLNNSDGGYIHPEKVKEPVVKIDDPKIDPNKVVGGSHISDEFAAKMFDTFSQMSGVRLAGEVGGKPVMTGSAEEVMEAVKDPSNFKKGLNFLRKHFFFLDTPTKIKTYMSSSNIFKKAGIEPGNKWYYRMAFRYSQYLKGVGVKAGTYGAYSWFGPDGTSPSINPVNWIVPALAYPFYGFWKDAYNLMPDSAKKRQMEANNYLLKEKTGKDAAEWSEEINNAISALMIPLLEDEYGGLDCGQIENKVKGVTDQQIQEAVKNHIEAVSGSETVSFVLETFGGVELISSKVIVNSEKLVSDLKVKHCDSAPASAENTPVFDVFDDKDFADKEEVTPEEGTGKGKKIKL